MSASLNSPPFHFDVLVLGSGPAGQSAALQAAKNGRKVALVEKDRLLGGACLHRGTIPSKILRESALRIKGWQDSNGQLQTTGEVEMASLSDRLDKILASQGERMIAEIRENNVETIHGRAEFADPHTVLVTDLHGTSIAYRADAFVIATGSIPQTSPGIPVDHEHIFDSDSILSLLYLPRSLTVVGSGSIACEYASIFQALGVKVTLVDRGGLPLKTFDTSFGEVFVHSFEAMGGDWRPNVEVIKAEWDGLSHVNCHCSDGSTIRSEKLLCATGRRANVANLRIENAGLRLDNQGLLKVDRTMRTEVHHIFACGDVVGAGGLAPKAIEQGRRASALGGDIGSIARYTPRAVYSIPELSAVGLSEQQAREQHGSIIVGTAQFRELVRGQIIGSGNGTLKIVCDKRGRKILGVMIIGEGATELIHIGQMAMLSNSDVDIFLESSFNFPSLAEAYRVAALEVREKRSR